MMRLYFTVGFLAASAAGFALILYGVLTGQHRSQTQAEGEKLDLGFAGEDPIGTVLDLDIGHEGLKHRGKEAFDPDRHKPEPIEPRKKISES